MTTLKQPSNLRLGVAGWSMPPSLRLDPTAASPVLSQYAQVLNAVEINTSFSRSHAPATYERWARCVPPDFKFSVKVPRAISHDSGLILDENIRPFIDSASSLEEKLGVFLLQLPPTLSIDRRNARRFFKYWRSLSEVPVALEARHPTWFDLPAQQVLAEFNITPVWADPVPRGCKRADVDNREFAYLRLHGSPRMYYSEYSTSFLDDIASLIHDRGARAATWCIFDNTASGAAWGNAMALGESMIKF